MSPSSLPPVAIALPALALLLSQVNYVVLRLRRERYRRAVVSAVIGIGLGEVAVAVATGAVPASWFGPLILGGLHVIPDLVMGLLCALAARSLP